MKISKPKTKKQYIYSIIGMMILIICFAFIALGFTKEDAGMFIISSISFYSLVAVFGIVYILKIGKLGK
jgi:hypothetical protein